MDDSFGLAVDTGITEIIIVTNMLSPTGCRKIDFLCQTYSFHQLTAGPTNFTDHSCSLLDLIFVSNKDQVIHCGVEDPFLPQQLHLYSSIYGIFLNPKNTSFNPHVWYYERSNYDLNTVIASEVPLKTLKYDDIDIYADNLHNAVMTIARECIPNKHVKIKTIDPPWTTSSLKRHIRKRKREYKKAKRSYLNEIGRNLRQYSAML